MAAKLLGERHSTAVMRRPRCFFANDDDSNSMFTVRIASQGENGARRKHLGGDRPAARASASAAIYLFGHRPRVYLFEDIYADTAFADDPASSAACLRFPMMHLGGT